MRIGGGARMAIRFTNYEQLRVGRLALALGNYEDAAGSTRCKERRVRR
jgi:hypothetical protein